MVSKLRRNEYIVRHSHLMDGAEGEVRGRGSRLRVHLLGFVIASLAAILVLTLLGAPPLLIVEVFGLALILGAGAVMIIIVFGGRQRTRW